MNKNYTAQEVTEILNIPEHTLYAWIRNAMPMDIKPKKVLNEKLGRYVYSYTDKDLATLLVIKELRKEKLTYEEIKAKLMVNSIDKKSIYLDFPGETPLKEFKPDKTLKIVSLSISAITLLLTFTILIKIMAVGF